MRAALPLLALALAGCLASPLPAASLLPLDIGEAVRIDAAQPAREPAIVQAPDGTLFVAGFWGFGRHVEYPGTPANIAQSPLLWRSTDAGATWQRVDVGLVTSEAIGNSDPDLAVAPDGTLYYASLSYYSPPLPPGAPAPPALPAPTATTLSVTVGSSADNGGTWDWAILDRGSGRSHPWVAVQPDGTAHVVWGDGMGIQHASSRDQGATWAVQEQRPHDAGEAGGIVAWGRTLAVRVSPIGSDADGVAVSEDDGGAWRFIPLAREPVADPALGGFGSVAFDGEGTLYLVRTEGSAMGDVVRASRTLDLGGRWDTVTIVPAREGSVAHSPYARGGPAGELAVTWFTAAGETVAANLAHARWPPGVRGEPAVRLATFAEDTGGANHADYFQVTFLQGGGLGAAVPMTTPDMGQWFDYTSAR